VADAPLQGLRVVLRTLDAFYARRSLEWTVGIGSTLAELSGHTHSFGNTAQTKGSQPTSGPMGAVIGALGGVGDVLFGEDSQAKLTAEGVNSAKYRAAVLGLALLLSFYIHPMMGVTVVACGSVAYMIYTYIGDKQSSLKKECTEASWFDPSWISNCFFLYTTNVIIELEWAKYGLAVAGAMWVFNLLKPLIPMSDDEAAYADHATGMLNGAVDTASMFHQQIAGARRSSDLVLSRVAARTVGAGVTAYTGNTTGADLISSGTKLLMRDDDEDEREPNSRPKDKARIHV
jgi:hypothetical protein